MSDLIVTALVLIVPLIVPVMTVWSHPNWKGVLLGTIALFIFMAGALMFLIGLTGKAGFGLNFGIWIVLGLPISAFLCSALACLRRFTMKAP